MPDPRQLSAMMRLLDDSSSKVRDAVAEQLAGLGADLEETLLDLPDPPPEHTILMARQLVEQYLAVGTTATEEELEREAAAVVVPEPEPKEPRYEVGQIVRHKRYGYRGVVVEADETCQADDRWYKKNKSQPDREQPWYHVLVHDSQHVTYAAESNLLPDESEDDIKHPLVRYFFTRFENGRYERNDRPWPGWKR